MSKLKIGIQGILGSFHEMAARNFFGENIHPIECDTFKEECHKLDNDEVDYIVMAIENTIAGSLLANYSLLQEFHFHIIGEVFLHIQMHLMALPNTTIEQIEQIHSHPIAIRQCADYLQTLKHVRIVEKNDTAGAAKHISDNKLANIAAVANETAAKIYGLEIIEKRIETHKKNFTRFLVLSKLPSEKAKNSKASLSLQLGHQVGALANILNIFTQHKINLTKIQSVPILGKPYEYSFHIDVEWASDNLYEKAIMKILRNCANLSILGEYPKGEWDTPIELDKWVSV